jgi:hypothetical protein
MPVLASPRLIRRAAADSKELAKIACVYLHKSVSLENAVVIMNRCAREKSMTNCGFRGGNSSPRRGSG